jgi:hypothetical protein
MTWPGEGLLVKLWETLAEKGIGGLLKPWQMRREGVAQIELRRAELLALADAERLADEIRSGRRSASSIKNLVPLLQTEALALPAPAVEPPPTPIQVASCVVLADALRAEVNVAKAIAAAEEELREDPADVPASSINSDWIHRWREFAGGVSSADLQAIWGRILAGELKSPGKFGFRTLDFIRSLSSQEATKIEALSRFVIDDFIARSQMVLLESSGISFHDLLELQNLGLLSGAESIGLSVNYKSDAPEKFTKALCSHGKILLVRADDPKKELKVEIYGITGLGKQVMSLGKFDANEEYLRAVGGEIKAKGFAVELGNYVRINASQIRYTNARPL